MYASAVLDLDRDGPTVVEILPNCGPGTVNDAWFRFVVDMGAPGPDRGAGGKYPILPPGYDGMGRANTGSHLSGTRFIVRQQLYAIHRNFEVFDVAGTKIMSTWSATGRRSSPSTFSHASENVDRGDRQRRLGGTYYACVLENTPGMRMNL